MKYDNVLVYLNENVRKLVLWALEDGQPDKVMEVVDFILWKYVELNTEFKVIETYVDDSKIKTREFLNKVVEENYNYYEMLKDGWKNLPSPYTADEDIINKLSFLSREDEEIKEEKEEVDA